MFDPHSTEFRMALIAAYQAMLSSNEMTGQLEPAVILGELMAGGVPRYRAMGAAGWDSARGSAHNAAWVPVARVDVDGSVERLLR